MFFLCFSVSVCSLLADPPLFSLSKLSASSSHFFLFFFLFFSNLLYRFSRVFGTSMVEEIDELAESQYPPERLEYPDEEFGQ